MPDVGVASHHMSTSDPYVQRTAQAEGIAIMLFLLLSVNVLIGEIPVPSALNHHIHLHPPYHLRRLKVPVLRRHPQ